MAIEDIVNVALREVGEQSITAIDDTTPRGRIVGDIYTYVRDQVFRDHAWNFAVRRGGLAGFHHPEPDHGFARAFLLPSGSGNYNKAIRLLDVGGMRYKLEGRRVLSDQGGTMVNALSDQDDLTSANWTETGTGSTTANSTTSPDNADKADTVTDADAAAFFNVSQAVSVGNDNSHHFVGIKVKALTSVYATLQVKLTGGTPITAYTEIKFSDATLLRGGADADKIHSYDVEPLADSWFWLWMSVKNNQSGNSTLTYELHPTGLKSEVVTATGSIYAVDAWYESLPPLDGRWVELLTDPDDWSEDFKTLYATALARSLAIPIANSATLFQRFDARYKAELRAAKSIDAIEDFPEQFPESSWTAVRRGALT